MNESTITRPAMSPRISTIRRFISDHLCERVERRELCAFNNTCKAKYDLFGLDWPFKGKPLLDRHLGEQLLQTARRSLGRPAVVQLTGLI